ncbi:MAG: phosphopantetheine-binding protein [Bacillota bacterium]|nr:phosphopantetheine-binding protein [Bacillota bacterium]
MKDIASIVLNAYKKVAEEKGILNDKEPDLEISLSRENGLDSLGLVSMIVYIEEELDLELDDVLMDIRESSKIKDMVKLIEKAVNVDGGI